MLRSLGRVNGVFVELQCSVGRDFRVLLADEVWGNIKNCNAFPTISPYPPSFLIETHHSSTDHGR